MKKEQQRRIILNNNKKKPDPLQIRSRQKAPLTTRGYTPYVAKKVKKPDGSRGIKIYHAAGPIANAATTAAIIKPSFLGYEQQYEQEIVENWVPQLSLSVFEPNINNSAGGALTAADIDSIRSKNPAWMPHYFVNPMQDLDYITLEALARFTICGPIMDALTKFIVGTGFKPELELVNPSGNKDKDEKEIKANQDIIDALVQIDNQLNQTDRADNHIDASFMEKIAALITTTNIFNRAALIFGYEEPVSIDGKVYRQIPSSLKFAHARDLGIIDVDPGTWRLRAVQWRNAFYMVPAKDMIYLWNPFISAKTRGSWLYGDSLMMAMIDASRVIRKNIGVNFPAMAEATWAGMYVLTVRPQGETRADKEKEYQDIASRMVRGGPNILLENPEDTKTDVIDFAPKVTEFKDLTEFLIRYCVSTTGLPQTMFYDEASANRATMIGRIQLAISTAINPMRAWIGRSIADQWYMRWFRVICKEKGRQELLKKFRVKMVFSDLHIEEWFDKVEAVNVLDSRKQLTDQAYGELAGIDNYANKVEPDAIVTPGGNGGSRTFKFGDGRQGFEIKNTSSSTSLSAKERLDLETAQYRKRILKKIEAELDNK